MSSDEIIGVIYNPEHVLHSTPEPSYLEQPERLIRIIRYLKKVDAFTERCVMVSDFESASMEDVLRVHDLDYLRFVKNYCDHGGGFLGDSTYFSRASFTAALQAAGGAIEASRLMFEKKYSSCFALIRPPGHHATRSIFGGFCILNNAAIAAQYLIARENLDRIMIIDWDAHAANGTMSVFYESAKVLLLSIHLDPKEFYPRDGFTHQIGRGEGRGYTINVEMPENSGDDEYRRVIEEIVIPVYEQYKPQFVIGCCGFDAHWSDDSSKLMLTSNGYYDMVNTIKKHSGSAAILLEGGYSKFNGRLSHTVIKALQNQKIGYKEEVSKPNIDSKVNKKLSNLKKLLSEFYKF